MLNDTNSQGHVRYSHYYHIIWIPKYRRPVLDGVVGELCEILIKDYANQRRLRVISLVVESDHVHLLIEIPPKHSVSSIVGELKSKTAIVLKRAFPEKINKYLWRGDVLWARGFYSCTVGGLNKGEVQDYIALHEKHR